MTGRCNSNGVRALLEKTARLIVVLIIIVVFFFLLLFVGVVSGWRRGSLLALRRGSGLGSNRLLVLVDVDFLVKNTV